MRTLRTSLILLLCLACLFTIVSCGDDSPSELKHTHTLKERHIDAPCYEYGYTEVYCEYCNYHVRVTDSKLGNHKQITTRYRLCCEDGYTEITCEYCDYKEIIPTTTAGEHNYKDYHEIDIEPGPKTPGQESRHCEWYESCGSYIDPRVIEPKGEDLPPKPL